MIQVVKNILARYGLTRAIFYSILTQGWSLLAAPATMLIIVHRLSAEEQGFYYTFNSILALQIFVELGLTTVIVQTASHEWAFLKLTDHGGIQGNPDALMRLAGLLRFSLRWYAVCGLLIMAGLSVAGYFFFNSPPHPFIAWQFPWFALCLVAGLALMMSPVFSLIEGCNQVAAIYGFRLVQWIISSLVIMAGLMLGVGLFALALSALARFLCGVIFVLWKYRRFVFQLLHLSRDCAGHLHWRDEIWPFQWRIAISWLSGYFIFSLFNPVMFHYHGAKVAGQMGMTLALVGVVGSFANAWINTRTPQFGMLIARREYGALDHLFHRLLSVVLGLGLLGSTVLWMLVYGLHAGGWASGNRLLPVWPVTLLLAQGILNILVGAMALYLRAHKREPMMGVSVISAILIGLSTWVLGRRFGPLGAAAGYLTVAAVWGLPSCYVIFRHCRRVWHAEAPTFSDGVNKFSIAGI